MKALASRIGHYRGLALGGGIGSLVAIQIVTSFLIQVVVLRIVGAGEMTDAFIAAQTIPLIAASIVGTALQNIWQPRLAVAGDEWGPELGRALTMTIAIVFPIFVILFVGAPLAMRWLFVGFTPSQIRLTTVITQINLAAMVFNITGLVVAAGGRAQSRFLLVELMPAALAVVALVLIVIVVPDAGVTGAAWILAGRAMIGSVLVWAVLGAPMLRDPRDMNLRSTARAAFALMGGSAFYKLGPLVDRFWGSQAITGQMTLFNLAQTGMGALASLLERALALPSVPALSRALKAKDYPAVRSLYRRTLMVVWLVVGIVIASGVCIAVPLHFWIAGLLKLDEDQALFLVYTGIALTGFLGVAAGGVVINSAFYAMGDVKTPISVGTLGFFLGLIIKSIAFLKSGLLAMAIGTSIYYIGTMLVMVFLFERRLVRHENA